MNNKYVKIGVVAYLIIATVAIIFLLTVRVTQEQRLKEASKLIEQQQKTFAKVEAIDSALNRLNRNIQIIEQHEADTIKYYYTIDRRIVNLDNFGQSTLFARNTKELLKLEREGYFDIDKP